MKGAPEVVTEIRKPAMMASKQGRRKLCVLCPGATSPKQGLALCSSVLNTSISMLVSFETHHPHWKCIVVLCGAACSMFLGFPLAAAKQKNTFQAASGHSALRTRLLGTKTAEYPAVRVSHLHHQPLLFVDVFLPCCTTCLVYVLNPTSSYLTETFRCFKHWRKLGGKYLTLI